MAARTLTRIPVSCEPVACEMGDEDGCPNEATHMLDAPASYVIPLYCCPDHAAEEMELGANLVVAA